MNIVDQEVAKVSKTEVIRTLKRMKSGKAVSPDCIPVEVWKRLEEVAVALLTGTFNKILESERIPEDWRRSGPVLIFKNKRDVQRNKGTTEE